MGMRMNVAGKGGEGVPVDFAGRGWEHILVPVQLSNKNPRGPIDFVEFIGTKKSPDAADIS